MKQVINRLLACFLLVLYSSAFAIKQKPLMVVLDWFVNPNHAPLFVAEQEGFFAQQGIEVKFIPPADTSEGEKMVVANQADIAVTYQPALIYKTIHGLPLTQFATLINSPLNCLVVLKDGPIHSLKDLKGKRIGYSAIGNNSIVLATMLKNAGLTPNDVELINVKFNLTQALLTSKIDGFTGGMRNFEPVIMELAGKPVRMFYPENHGFPMYDELIFVTNKNKINDPALTKFVKALRQGVAYLQENPEKSWQKFAKNHPELNNPLNEKVWFLTLPYFASDPAKIDRARYQNILNFISSEATTFLNSTR
ncbi:MAG: ABC transporter, periplasmic [uncultured bacterium]|nr:MAG: ABC transporter, periplasmic [uncultured bacterium]